jgi:hypothetical protein
VVVTLIDCSADTRRLQGETDDEIDDNYDGPVGDGDGDTENASEKEPSVTPVSSHLPSPMDQIRSDGGRLMQTDSTTTVAFQESFGSETVKDEDGSTMSDSYPGSEGRALYRRNAPQRVSPVAETIREDFEHEMYSRGGSLVSDPQTHQNMLTMEDIRNYQDHGQGMPNWATTIPPDMYLPTYATHPGFQPHAMTMEDQVGFDEYHHSPNSRRHTMTHGLIYTGHRQYPPGFTVHDQRGLPMRTVSDLRQNLMAHEAEMVPFPLPFYPP